MSESIQPGNGGHNRKDEKEIANLHPSPAEIAILAGLDPEAEAGDLPPEAAAHCAACPECRDALARFEALAEDREIFSSLPDQPAPRAGERASRFRTVFFGADESGEPESPGRDHHRSQISRFNRPLCILLPVAAAVLILLFGTDLFRGGNDRLVLRDLTIGFMTDGFENGDVQRSGQENRSRTEYQLEKWSPVSRGFPALLPDQEFWLTGTVNVSSWVYPLAVVGEGAGRKYEALQANLAGDHFLFTEEGKPFRVPDGTYTMGETDEFLLLVASATRLEKKERAALADVLTRSLRREEKRGSGIEQRLREWEADPAPESDPLLRLEEAHLRALEKAGFDSMTIMAVFIPVETE